MKKFIAVLAASAMLASATSVFADYSENFEWTDTEVGTSVNGKNGWSVGVDESNRYLSVVADPVNANEKSLLFYGGHGTNGFSGSVSFSPVSSEDNVVEVSFRTTSPSHSEAYDDHVIFKSGNEKIAQMTILYRNTGGTDMQGNTVTGNGFQYVLFDGSSGVNFTQTNPKDGILPYSSLTLTEPGGVWQYMKFIINFNTHTVDAYVSTSPITASDSPVVVGHPFLTESDVNSIDTIGISKGYYARGNLYLDDISVKPYVAPAAPVVLTTYGDNNGVSAEHNNTTGTIQFASQVTGADAASAGACIVPVSLFTDADAAATALETNNASIARVSVSGPVTAGQTFGARITGVPSTQFDRQLIAKPFVVVDSVTQWATYTQQSSINAAVAAYLAAQE